MGGSPPNDVAFSLTGLLVMKPSRRPSGEKKGISVAFCARERRAVELVTPLYPELRPLLGRPDIDQARAVRRNGDPPADVHRLDLLADRQCQAETDHRSRGGPAEPAPRCEPRQQCEPGDGGRSTARHRPRQSARGRDEDGVRQCLAPSRPDQRLRELGRRWKRSAGSFAIALCTAAATCAGMVSRLAVTGIGFSVITFAMIACAVLPV